MIKELNSKNFDNEIKGKAVVEFYSPACNHCKKLEAGLKTIKNTDEIIFGKVDIESEVSLAEEYDITSVPTLLYFKDGKVVDKSIGFIHPFIIAENITRL